MPRETHPWRLAAAKRTLGMGALAMALVMALAAGGCDDMDDQPRGKPQTYSDFFNDGAISRPVVAGTVARSQGDDDDAFHTGFDDQGKALKDIPIPVTAELLARGRERFTIYCTECHGQIGDGRGMVVQRGFPAPPTYHIDRLRQAPAGHFFDVISNGFGKMPPYRIQIEPRDRWAIIAYIRALQLSEHATLADVPATQRATLEAAP